MDEAALLALDRAHVWHPYGPQPATQTPLVIGSAEGVRLRLRDGRELIDGMASWWCAIHGYRHPALDAAARAQLDRMSHVMFGGLTHEPAVALAAELVAITPPGLEHVFFADSGSVAVEVALKMVLQAARATNGPQKCRVMAFRGGYHGDTFGAMGLCDPVSGMHHLFADQLPGHVFAPRPPGGALDAELADADADALADLFAEHGDELAAVFVEPVVQGAGGMWFSPAAHLRLLRELCDLYGVLLVADEIATGFYRTGGHAFACGHAGVTPDVLCVGKALTGGYLTLSAALCTPDVAAAISEGEGGALMHGPTFMGNPLACAIAGASLQLLADGDPVARVAAVEAGLQAGLGTLRGADGVVDVRVRGALGVVQLDHPVDVAAATAAAVAAGVWVRPFRDLVYVMPAYVMDDDDVASLCAGVRAAAAAG